MATEAVVPKTHVFPRQLHIPKSNEFATISNLQALQHSYQNNKLSSLISVSREHLKHNSPYSTHTRMRHTWYTHTQTQAILTRRYAFRNSQRDPIYNSTGNISVASSHTNKRLVKKNYCSDCRLLVVFGCLCRHTVHTFNFPLWSKMRVWFLKHWVGHESWIK